jgi:hypothetical protein
LNGNPPGIRTAVEGTRSQASVGTAGIVLLVVAVVLWILFAVSAVTQAADETGSYRIGAFIGRLLGSLLIAFLVRAGYRFARRRDVLRPTWTPSLFFGAALIEILAAAGAAN